jgi:hypothetical protein
VGPRPGLVDNPHGLFLSPHLHPRTGHEHPKWLRPGKEARGFRRLAPKIWLKARREALPQGPSTESLVRAKFAKLFSLVFAISPFSQALACVKSEILTNICLTFHLLP